MPSEPDEVHVTHLNHSTCGRPAKCVCSCIVYIECVRDMYAMYVLRIQPPAKDRKAKNDACQEL